MDIDIYQSCPCQSGKKVKFCCSKDILPDLNQILSLHHGKQFIAAIEKVDRVVEKAGPQACLLGLKTHILIHLKKYEEATQVNGQFMQSHPRNPLGYQHAALLFAAEGKTAEAVAALQNGLDACSSNAIPITMANAFRTVGMLLMSQGQVVAGRAHLIFASELRQGQDEVVSQLVLQTFRSPEIPLLLKSEFPLFQPEESSTQPWKDRYINTMRFAGRARWRAARVLIEKLIIEFPGQPELLHARAVWSMYLAESEEARSSLYRYSELEGVLHDRAVEARATSFVIDDQPVTGAYDFVQATYSLSDPQAIGEAAAASQRLITGSIFGHNFIDPEAPPPVGGFLLLNKDEVREITNASGNEFPQVVAEVLVFGRQTDREARAEVYCVRDDQYEDIQSQFKDAFGDAWGQREGELTVEQISILDHDMSFRWHLPKDMSLEQRQEFIAEQREREYLEIFPSIPFQSLGGSTPEEAAAKTDCKLDVEALILMMEQGADAQASNTFEFNRLREKLGLPSPQPINTEERDFDQLSPIETQRVDFESLPDESLIKAYVLASSCGNIRVLRDAGPVVLSRPEMEKFIRFEMVYVMLSRLTADTDKALELMQKARSHASAAERPIGGILIDELELRLERNRPEGCQELLRVLQAHHLKDPQNQYRLASVLQRFGIMGPDGQMRSDPAESAAQPTGAGAGSDLWTPDNPAASAVPAESGESKSGLWLPD